MGGTRWTAWAAWDETGYAGQDRLCRTRWAARDETGCKRQDGLDGMRWAGWDCTGCMRWAAWMHKMGHTKTGWTAQDEAS